MAIRASVWGCVLALVLNAGPMAWAQAIKGATNPEQVMPSQSTVQFRYDGMAAHEAAWKKTAAHKALIDSELYDNLKKFAMGLPDRRPSGRRWSAWSSMFSRRA
jgi:hypothetical protein